MCGEPGRNGGKGRSRERVGVPVASGFAGLLLGLAGLVLGSDLGAAPPGASSTDPEVRALWVVRTALAHPDSARHAVRRAQEAGFNTLLVQVRGRGDAYYWSRWEPRAEALQARDPGYDPLAVVLEEASGTGVSVHAWVNALLVASAVNLPEDRRHVVHARPHLLAVPRSLARELYSMDPTDPGYVAALARHARERSGEVEGLYLSPAQPEAHEHLHSVWTDILDHYMVDGIHLDYIRLPSQEFDYSRGALDRFREWVRPRISSREWEEANRRHVADPLAFPQAFPQHWDAFRREGVTQLVERARWSLRQRRADALLTAAVFPDPGQASGTRFQEWAEWVGRGLLDAVAPMAYTDDDSVFRGQLTRAAEVAGAARVWAGVGIYQNSLEGAVRKARMARSLGLGGVALFSYDWAVQPEGVQAAGGPYLPRFAQEVFGGGP